jgi:hypothetical protein
MENVAPANSLLIRLFLVAFFTAGLGWMVFRARKRHFYDYL